MLTLLFPGQGSQYASMGKALCEAHDVARDTFAAANVALGFDLQSLCFEGPEDRLKQTEITQPAILTTSVAALRVIRSLRPGLEVSFAAGHSLGEWSALVAVGALGFEDAVRLVHQRGKLMQAAVPQGEGAMAAILGLEPSAVANICNEVSQKNGESVQAANFNSKQQTVISGTAKGVELATGQLSAAGASKVVPLPVSAPFHSSLMKPAADGLAAALETVQVSALTHPVVSNVDAMPNQDAERVKSLLVEQVTAPVRWVETIEWLVKNGATTAFEVGPGKVLMGLTRRIDRTLKVHPAGEPAQIEKALASLG